MIKTVLVPGAPWPEVTPPTEKAKPKRKWVPKQNTGSRKEQTDRNFEAWLKGNS